MLVSLVEYSMENRLYYIQNYILQTQRSAIKVHEAQYVRGSMRLDMNYATVLAYRQL